MPVAAGALAMLICGIFTLWVLARRSQRLLRVRTYAVILTLNIGCASVALPIVAMALDGPWLLR